MHFKMPGQGTIQDDTKGAVIMEKETGCGALLYEKMRAEQEQYKSWLTKQAPEEILSHAYKYSVREDILFAMESTELTEEQVKALLSSPGPLADVYRIWEKRESSLMEEITSAIEGCADALIRRGGG